MPTYTFRSKNSGEVFDKFMSISAREQFLLDNPQLEVVIGATAFNYGTNQKPDAGFRDVLKEINSKHDRRLTRSNINTW
jgi:hypothetical protein